MVTVIGLGLMGRALVGAFLESGRPTTIWNRSAEKAEELVTRGATLATSPEEAIAANPLIVVCVSDYDAMHEILDPLADVLANRVLVNLSSGTSKQARDTAEWAARHGIDYLDGVILAIPPAIGTDDAIILTSGSQSAFDQHEPTLNSLGTTTYVGTDHGLSALHDMAVLSIMWSVLNGFLQGAALLETAGVKAAAFAPLANQTVTTITDWITAYADQIDGGDYPADDSTIDTHLGAMRHLIHESEAAGIGTELPRLVKALADQAVAAGHGGASYAAMIEQFRATTVP